MTYQETIDFLFSQLPQFSKIGTAAYKKDLSNTLALCQFLDNPQQHFSSIHIAGTNGKGSTAHALASIFQHAGFKTGLYTSPHISDFRERIKLNGNMCSEEFVIRFVEKIKPCLATIQPSFFEITVAMAFQFFAEQKVDIAIIETGLGGRLDSTNVINPLLSIITNITYDHQSILGDTLDEIATEKAGIIKPNTPVVIGRKQVDIAYVFKFKADEEKSKLFFADDVIDVLNVNSNPLNIELTYKNNIDQSEHHIFSDLNAFYQIENIKSVLAAIAVYNQFYEKIDFEAVKNGLKTVRLTTHFNGRWQVLQEQPKIVADVGHNEDGIVQVLHQLEKEKYENLYIIYSAVKDKDVDKIIRLFPKNAHFYLTEANLERKMPVEILSKKFEQHHLDYKLFKQPKLAFEAAKADATSSDFILIVGSFFILDDILR